MTGIKPGVAFGFPRSRDLGEVGDEVAVAGLLGRRVRQPKQHGWVDGEEQAETARVFDDPAALGKHLDRASRQRLAGLR